MSYNYPKQKPSTAFLYGPEPPPVWLQNLERASFTCRNDSKLFDKARANTEPHTPNPPSQIEMVRALGLTALA